jgi:hypothetical protein
VFEALDDGDAAELDVSFDDAPAALVDRARPE